MALTSKLVNIDGLQEESGVPKRTLRTLFHARKIPGIRAGYRTLLFDPAKVRAALEKLEIKAATK